MTLPRKFACVFALVIASQPPAGATDLLGAPIDVTMFREGEVKRSHRAFGDWTLTCDEIARLGRRYCSLSAAPRDAEGRPALSLIVSTGDDGRPAAMVRAPLDVDVAAGVIINVAVKTEKMPEKIERRLDFNRCEADGCLAIWTLSPRETLALNRAGALSLRFNRIGLAASLAPRLARGPHVRAVEAAVATDGFSEAVSASVR